MIVQRINQLIDTDRDVDGIGFKSIRPILKKDGMGFSVHKTIIPKGGPYHWHYENHLEACYCIKGTGILTDLKTGVCHHITRDVIYALNNHDDHTFEAIEDVILISIFNPAINNTEIHDKKGSYQI